LWLAAAAGFIPHHIQIELVLGKVDEGVSFEVVREAVCGAGAQRPPESIVNFAVNCIGANLSVNFAENSIEGGAYSIER
jgi:hypothetical protein